VDTAVYEIPTDHPEADGTLAWSSTTMVVVEARAGGQSGLGWTYAGAGSATVVKEQLSAICVGASPMDVPGLNERMARACRNLGRSGLVASAISATDIALWDLKARLMELPLTGLFGQARADVPVYGSGGFTTYDEATARAQLEQWVEVWRIPRVKIKIGESWGADTRRDLARVTLARRVVGDDVELYVDANGGYTRKQAVRMGRAFHEDHGVTWFEEPVSSDDLAGLREVRDNCGADVAAGEYGYRLDYFARMVGADAVDCVQADVTRCGGYTIWLRAASVAAAHNLQISGHCGP
jgi:L-alanine-DL-glutamate epimerase-like enolase superfamily enzyme